MASRTSGLRTSMDEITQREIADRGTEEMHQVNARLEEILDEAPSDASAEILIRRGRGGFHGLLKIYSSQRRFVGGGRGVNFQTVIERIFGEVREQISEWKATRTFSIEGGV